MSTHPHITVVFIAQLGTGGGSWHPVIDHMTSGAATFTYDRPGTGTAPPRPAPNPPLPYSAMACELEALLDSRGVEGPLVVVGHSIGSLIGRMFADRNLDRISGVVHIDGSIPRRSFYPVMDSPPAYDGDGPGATRLDDLRGEVEIIEARIPAVPAAVVVRCPGFWWESGQAPAGVDALWFAHQRQLARQMHTPLIVAASAGHQIPAEAPRLTAYVIDEVVRSCVTGSRPRFDVDALKSVGGDLVDGSPRWAPLTSTHPNTHMEER